MDKQEDEHQLFPDTRKLDLATHLNTNQEGGDQLEGKGKYEMVTGANVKKVQ